MLSKFRQLLCKHKYYYSIISIAPIAKSNRTSIAVKCSKCGKVDMKVNNYMKKYETQELEND